MAALSPAALSDARILAAYVIFLASYVVFALGKFPGLKIDRTGAAIIGAVGMVAFRITGSVANIIVVESAKPEVEIEFRDHLRAGAPITILTLLAGWAWLTWVR